MKLISFMAGDKRVRVGAVKETGVFDLVAHIDDCPGDMIALIGRWAEFSDRIHSCVEENEADWTLGQVELLAPVPRPGKVMGIGLNYADHIAESGFAVPDYQVWFSKAVTAVNGPYRPITLPKVSNTLDYEAELAFVVGRRCRHVPRDQAHQVIFGYCVANDVSVREWQLRTSQFILGKSFDTHAPFGPWIVTADELTDPHRLDIRSFVNGEERQHSNTREFIFDCFDMVSHLSAAMTLEPGDVILTGTPSGVGAGLKPPRFLAAGDVVRVEIESIGAIENRVDPE